MHRSLERRDGVARYQNSFTSRTVFGAAPRRSDILAEPWAEPCVYKQFASFVLKGDSLGQTLISFGFCPILTFQKILEAMDMAIAQLFHEVVHPAALHFL